MSSENPTDSAPIEGAPNPPTPVEAPPPAPSTEPGPETTASEAVASEPTETTPPAVDPLPPETTSTPSPDDAPSEAASSAPAEDPVEPEAAEAGEREDDTPAEPEEGDEFADEMPAEEEEADEESEAVPLEAPPGRPASVNVVLIPLSLIDDDSTFQLREDPDVAGLATSIARVGQYVPIEVRPLSGRMQVISGFRRLAAVRLLHREEVLARVHEGMNDEDALVLSLAQGLEQRGFTPEQLHALRDRLQAERSLTPQARGLIEAALVTPGSDLEPESGEASDEVDLDELASDLERRLSGISADLSAVTDLWDEMDEGPRSALLDQLRYYAELHAFYSRRR